MSINAKQKGSYRISAVILIPLLLTILVLSAIAYTNLGTAHIPVSGVLDVISAHLGSGKSIPRNWNLIIWDIRLPRVILAAIVGAGLSIAGAGMQTLVQNPLADPYLLGISSGAGMGATSVIVMGTTFGLGIWALPIGAFIGAIVAAVVVFGIATLQGGLTPIRLILTGFVMSAAFSSIASFMVFFSSDPHASQSVLFWMLGSLSGAQWNTLYAPLGALIIGFISFWMLSGWLDALSHGEEVALSLGIPVFKIRIVLFLILSLLVGIMVAASGGIGFIGLIVPHITRIFVGRRHRIVLPVCAAMGAVFLVWVDIVARILVPPQEIPLGVVTGIVGAPIFLILLGRRHYAFGGN